VSDRTTTSDDTGTDSPDPCSELRIGSTVRVLDEAGGLHTWTIVRPSESDVRAGKLSVESPVAKALLGHVAADTVIARTPRGARRYTVRELVSQH
jgi:transcription elongation factor GreB